MTVTEILETNPEKLETFNPKKECYREETEYFQQNEQLFGEYQLKLRGVSSRRDEILGQKLQLFSLEKCGEILTGKKYYKVISGDIKFPNTCLHNKTPRLLLSLLPISVAISIIYMGINFNPRWLAWFIGWLPGTIALACFAECSGVFNKWDLQLDNIYKLIVRIPFGVALKYKEARESNLFDEVFVLAPKSCWEREVYRDPLLLGKIGDEYVILAQW